MKKFLLTALLAVLALGCIHALAESGHTCSGGTATCDARAVCITCGKAYGHLADHNWGPWVSDNATTHTRTCRTNAGHTETRYHSGGRSTCTQGASCVYCGAVHDEPLGHIDTDYPGYPATCISDGATDGVVCSRCGDTLTPRRVIPAKGHAYSTWLPQAGGTHTATCTTPGCGATGETACTFLSVRLAETDHAVCPICGALGETVLPVLISRAEAALPMGQLLVRGAAEAIPGTLYAFTVTGSYAGNTIELDGKAAITLPEDLSALPAFTLVRVALTPAGEQHLEDIPFRMAEGRITFTADKGGLYLLVPAE